MEIKNGQDFLKTFFSDIQKNKELDDKTIKVIVDLFENHQLTTSNISNNLREIREKTGKDN